MKNSLKQSHRFPYFLILLFVYMALLLTWQVRSIEPLCYRGAIITPAASSSTAQLSSGQSESQTIVIPTGTYQGILFQLDGVGDGTATVTIFDQEQNVMCQSSFSLRQLNSSFQLVRFDFSSSHNDTEWTAQFSCFSDSDGKLYIKTNDANACVPYRFVYHVLNMNLFTLALVSALLLLFLIIHVFVHSNISFEGKFACLFVALGVLFSLALPPLDGPDELSHFLRVLEISRGQLITGESPSGPSGILPSYYNSTFIPVRYYLTHLNDKLDFESPVGMLFQNTSVYSPITYLPQAIGAFVVRLFTTNKLITFFAIRLSNLLSIAVLLYFAIKSLPHHKAWMAAISLLPPVIQGSCTVSADGLPFALCCCIISLVSRLKEEAGPLSAKDVFYLYLIPLLLGQCKIVYVTVCLLLFLIPKSRFKSQSNFFVHVLSLGFLLIITSVGWTSFASRYLVFPMNEGVNTPAQLSAVLHNPIKFAWTCIMTLFADDGRVWYQLFGSYLGWQTVYIVKAIILPLIAWSFIALFCDEPSPSPSTKTIAVNFVTVFATVGITLLSLFIQFTPFGHSTILGIQGRYFLPVFFLFGEMLYGLLPRQSRATLSLSALLEGSSLLSCSAILYMLVQTI